LVEHLKDVLGDPEAAERLATEGQLTAERHCDLSAIARDFADLCAGTAQADAAALARA
jgi:hypothetical protein